MIPEEKAPQQKGREGQTIALVGGAHLASHLFQLALAPLFPILHQVFGVGFTELGLIATLFYAASGFSQAFLAGPLSDRYGAHRVLVGGMGLISASILLAGLSPAYWVFLPLGVLAGLGNSVFHPADLSILSLRVPERRLGRAYSIHSLSGALGYVAAPILITTLASLFSWRWALSLCGAAGLAFTALLHTHRHLIHCDARSEDALTRQAGPGPGWTGVYRALCTPVILMGFAYFVLSAFANQGMQSQGIAILIHTFGWGLSTAALAVTIYLTANTAGVMAGGLLAERTDQHHRVAMSGMITAAAAMLGLFGSGGFLPLVVLLMFLSGAAYGITQPSRDIIIRKAAAGSGLGSVFGFVYSGFDLSSGTAPLILGAMIDHDWPQSTFLVMASLLLLAIPTVRQVRRPDSSRSAPG